MAAMASVLNWFGFQKARAKSDQEHSRFNFSWQLINDLRGDHAELLEQYAGIEKLAVEGRYASIPPVLSAFKANFDIHILNENLHFYCYVEQKLSGTPDKLDVIKAFRTEMNGIARGVVNFVKKYNMAGVRPSNGGEFLVELRQVGKLLVQRIQREEQDLYPLYTP